MTNFLIPETHRFDGTWFLPGGAEEESRRIAGQFEWRGKEGRLSLHDSFAPFQGPVYGVDVKGPAPVIHGIAGTNSVTLLNNHEIGIKYSFGNDRLHQAQSVASRSELTHLGGGFARWV